MVVNSQLKVKAVLFNDHFQKVDFFCRMKSKSSQPLLMVTKYSSILIAFMVTCVLSLAFVSTKVHRSVASTASLATKHLRSVSNNKSISQTANFTTANQGQNFTMSEDRAPIPPIIYGTAWKKERTQELVDKAIRTGFRGVDTACQPKHYFEKGVGDALEQLYADEVIKREDVFLQTKFTSLDGQHPNNIPYDKNAALEEQVLQSFQKSLSNLRTTYLDSLVMHSPMKTIQDTMRVWRVFESILKEGGVKFLGLSNTYNIRVLQAVYDQSEIKPSFLQNRFYRDSGYDVEIREFCKAHDIKYQSFWTLTANPEALHSPVLLQIARKYNKTAEQIFYRFIQSQGMIPLSGTKSEIHMREDLQAVDIPLEAEEIARISSLLY